MSEADNAVPAPQETPETAAPYAAEQTAVPAHGFHAKDRRLLLGVLAGLVAGAMLLGSAIAVAALFHGSIGARRGAFVAGPSVSRGGRMMDGRGSDGAYGYGNRGATPQQCPGYGGTSAGPRGGRGGAPRGGCPTCPAPGAPAQ